MKLLPVPVAPVTRTCCCSSIQRQVASWRMTALSSSRPALGGHLKTGYYVVLSIIAVVLTT
jgi:hypothetical protein